MSGFDVLFPRYNSLRYNLLYNWVNTLGIALVPDYRFHRRDQLEEHQKLLLFWCLFCYFQHWLFWQPLSWMGKPSANLDSSKPTQILKHCHCWWSSWPLSPSRSVYFWPQDPTISNSMQTVWSLDVPGVPCCWCSFAKI